MTAPANFKMPSFVDNKNTNAAPTNVAPGAPAQAANVVEQAFSKPERAKRVVKATRTVNAEDEQYFLDNIKTKSYAEMAEERGLTVSQITTYIGAIKKGAREYVLELDANAYPTFMQTRNGKEIKMYDYDSPQTDAAKQIEAELTRLWCRPEDAKVGGKKSATAGMINKRISSLIEGLGK
jgi:hypothetical protein